MNIEKYDRDIILEYMRSLPDDYIVNMITDMIYNSISFPYTNFINMIRYNNISILKAPSYEDKLLLLRSIIVYFSIYTDKYDFLIENHIKALTKVYNDFNMTTINYEEIPFNDILFIKTEDRNLWHMYDIIFIPEKIILDIEDKFKNKTKLSSEILNLIKIQMFIFTSVWIDMDELLIYLFKYHTKEEPEA